MNAHLMARRTNHHRNRQQHVQNGSDIPREEKTRDAVAGNAGGNQKTNGQRHSRCHHQSGPRVDLAKQSISLPTHLQRSLQRSRMISAACVSDAK
jgi:hypothetical protein